MRKGGWADEQFVWIENLGRDFRFGFRQIVRSPGFATIAIFTLSLGIGANAAIFSLVNAIILRPLPYPSPEQLMGWGNGGTKRRGLCADGRVRAQHGRHRKADEDLPEGRLLSRWSGFI